MNSVWIEDVIAFWFERLRPKDWWRASPVVDAEVRERFGALLAELTADPPSVTTLDARGHLAAVIVFDQFPRNLFRGTQAAFATDPVALKIAIDAIDRGLDHALPEVQRHFLYMPLMHSEDAGIQERSLALFATLDDPRALRSARLHRQTIVRFGRFPARNDALGRTSTADEIDDPAGRMSDD